MDKTSLSKIIKDFASKEGFMFCGISKAEFLEHEAPKLENWLNQNRHGKMKWMENHFDKRLDPRLLVENAKSVITVLLNYFPQNEIISSSPYKISKYAYGMDYHEVIKQKLGNLLNNIKNTAGEINGRAFVDSAPVMDKAWAQKSGAGWLGKNTNIIQPKAGSFFFIGELIVDVELDYDGPIKDYCGTCTKCIDACPTQAITEPYVVDGSKCISYLTIELKENIPLEFADKMDNWIFGCDVCQDVCPWNRFSIPNKEEKFNVSASLKEINWEDINYIEEESFKKSFANSPIKRAKLSGMRKNINFLKYNDSIENLLE